MKNLEDYGVVSLDDGTIKNVDGGLIPGVDFWVNLSIFCAGFQEGWNENKKKE